MDLRKVKKLIELLEESGIAEIEIKEGEESVRITRMVPAGSVPQSPQVSAPVAMAQPIPLPPKPEGHVITSPMVGTFYGSPAPDVAPFVKVGQVVKVGEPLCIIEAMKIMNEIQAEAKGTIVEALVESGQAVEYGQRLFKIKQG